MQLLLLAGAYALFMGRKPGVFRSTAIIDALPGFYSHVSNFSISFLLYAGVGFMWLMIGVRMRLLVLAALALALANIAYELLVPVLNTRDPVDAAYGVAGTVLALAWIGIVGRVGFIPMPAAQ